MEKQLSTNSTKPVLLNSPRNRDSVFMITVSNISIAVLGVDFEPLLANITIFSDIAEEEYIQCVNISIVGDDEVEDDELIVLDVRALSEKDSVESVDDSSSLIVTVVDNDGKICTCSMSLHTSYFPLVHVIPF